MSADLLNQQASWKPFSRCYNPASLSGPVAQLVEQRIENPRVTGSIPVQATKFNPSISNVARVFCFLAQR